jgi:hypothetical protein
MKYVAVCWLLICLSGCGSSSTPAVGGTPGSLKFGTTVTSDIRLSVHLNQSGSFLSTGFATTASDGSFVLYSPDAKAPLWLEPGEYSFTLESIGPSLQLPDAYKKPELSPLKITWTSDMKSVDLEVPEKLLAH